MKSTLKLALVHFNIRHKETARNRERLLSLVAEAADNGADLVVAPEMSISGYAFESREDILPHAEPQDGPTLAALADAARALGIHICFGMAEVDPHTGILYNSAFALDPAGRILCHYRKINAESRWACPGNPRQDNTFDTPWGRMGILICSDSYHALMPRITAIRGADLLLVPANWPPTGLNPREIWRARALENGFYMAAVNRTGVDRTMDCRTAPSYACDPTGRALLDEIAAKSCVQYIRLPLTASGRLDNRTRKNRMADRRPEQYRDCCLNLKWIDDMTDFLGLPTPGVLDIHCIVPRKGEPPVEALSRHLNARSPAGDGLYLLPAHCYSIEELRHFSGIAASRRVHVAVRTSKDPDRTCHLFESTGKSRSFPLPPWPFNGNGRFPHVDVGPARLLLVPFAAMHHPEPAVGAAKLGSDMAVALEERIAPEDRLLAGVRTIENLAMAVCAKNDAGIWLPPEGHQRWEETCVDPDDMCHYSLDTRRTRRKRFQDAIDFERLLGIESA